MTRMCVGVWFAACLAVPTASLAAACDIAWDGDKVSAAISGRPTHLSVPLQSKQGHIPEVTVGQILAFSEARRRVATIAGLSPTFVICADAAPNAFAGKGKNGDIVGVTIGMMRLVDGDVDMAAAVIGHEFAHHTHNHGEDGAARDALIGLAGLLIGMAVDSRSQRRTGVSTNVGQIVGGFGATLISRKFSRDQEREADDTGFKYLLSAGFNPTGAIRLAERMNRGGSSGLFFDSHPGWDERGELFRAMIASSREAQEVIARSARSSTVAAASSQPSPEPVQSSSIGSAIEATDAQKSHAAAVSAFRRNDIVGAVENLRKSASMGYAPAQALLGFIVVRGYPGASSDEREAERLFRLASEQGDPLGQANLGYMYQRGLGGLAVDEVEAVRLYRLSSEQGHSQGQANLAGMYINGRGGLNRDDIEAVRLLRLSADQGNRSGQTTLGLMYVAGRGGLERNAHEGARLLRLGADKGNPIAQTALGHMHLRGLGGLEKDEQEAIRWFRLAAAQGNANAKKELAARGLQ